MGLLRFPICAQNVRSDKPRKLVLWEDFSSRRFPSTNLAFNTTKTMQSTEHLTWAYSRFLNINRGPYPFSTWNLQTATSLLQHSLTKLACCFNLCCWITITIKAKSSTCPVAGNSSSPSYASKICSLNFKNLYFFKAGTLNLKKSSQGCLLKNN